MFTFKGNTNIVTKTIPVVRVAPKAFSKMQHLVTWSDVEVGWLGVVKRLDHTYTIKDIFLFDQEVNSVTCEITPESLALFAEDLLKLKCGMEIFNNIRMWGHSHVNMPVSPSHQDDVQFEELAKNSGDYFIRVIANKKGELKVDLTDVEAGVTYLNIEWKLEDEFDSDYFYQEYLEKVKTKKQTFNFNKFDKSNIVDLECEEIESFEELVELFGLTNEEMKEIAHLQTPLEIKTYFESNILTPSEYISQEGYENILNIVSDYLYGL